MFGRFMPKEGRFFEFFNEHALAIVDGARELASLMAHFDDLQRRAYSIESIEKRADIELGEDALRLAAKPRSRPI